MTKLTLVILCLVALGVVFGFALSTSGSSTGQAEPGKPAPVAVASRLEITKQGNRVVLSGLVGSADLKRGLDMAASEAYGGSGYQDDLRLDAGAGLEAWWFNPASLLPPNAIKLGDKGVVITGETAEVSGSTDSEDKHQGYLARLRQADPNLEITDHIDVKTTQADPPKALQADLDRTVLNHTIEFETNSEVLSPDGRKLCQVIAEKLINMPDLNVEVDGYTDNVGEAGANLDLSQRRAESVCTFLSQNGVQRSRLTAKGFGQDGPVASNDSEDGRYRNRRIAFKVLGAK